MASIDLKFMKLAIAKAKQGIKKGQTPFGACIVRNGKVIAASHNRVWQTTDITAHAEIDAIRQACRKLKTIDLTGSTMYSTCEPCPMCFAACHWARISKIVYGAGIRDARAGGFNELSISNLKMKLLGKSKIDLKKGILSRENAALFKTWGNLIGKKAY